MFSAHTLFRCQSWCAGSSSVSVSDQYTSVSFVNGVRFYSRRRNIGLKPSEVEYILDHSGSSLILVDHEYRHLLPSNLKVPVIVSFDTGRDDDPYEQFLTNGRAFSQERGWGGLDCEADETAPAMLCYT